MFGWPKRLGMALVAGALALGLGLVAPATAQSDDDEKASALSSLPLRLIGPAYPSGRVSDFAFFSGGHHHYLVATASGGLWVTENAGATWTPLFDREGSYAIGVVEIAPSDEKTIWVGTGENNAQRSVAFGDGVYKSTDGGKTWTNMGLKESGHISQIWIDPKDANTVLVAAQGPLWSEGGDRGLYKTTDGGANWERVLEIDEHTGINEFVVHPDDPDLIVASSYQRRRHVWVLINGGPGSGIHRTTDGGENWTKISAGLPSDDMGRIGLAMAPSNADIVYAIIEGQPEEQGVYRSSDFGQSWEKRSEHKTTSPQYYNEIVVDPKDADTLYSLDTFSKRSSDGGKTFTDLSNAARHVDDHALWIDEANTKHLIMGGDGGVYESWDGGQRWRHVDNLPIVQFYRIQPDNAEPFYNVCGGTQDNNSLCGPSRTTVVHGITNSDWHIVLGGDGYKPQIDPRDPNIVYTQYQYGGLARYDRRTQERVFLTPQPEPGEPAYKWNWNTPILISPHNPDRIYYAAEYLFASNDRGNTWEKISPDLTRQIDRNALPVMGRVWSVDAIAKNDSTSIFGAAISISESPLAQGLIYVGTDDGVISVTEDNGATWRRSEMVRGVPDMTLVEDIVTSQHSPDVAYAVFDNHKRGDYKPYVFLTADRGRSWQPIMGDLPPRGAAHTIAEDHVDPDLLFVGTEDGLFYTQDRGGSWSRLKANLPTIAVRDLEIQRRENDLVVGTFGRSIYILDDYTPLRTDAESVANEEATLFEVRDPWLYVEGDLWGGGSAQAFNGDDFWFAENPPFGAVFTYALRDGLETRAQTRRKGERKIEKEGGDTPYPSWDALRAEDREDPPAIVFTITDASGNVVRRMTAPHTPGLHRVAWNLRYAAPDPVTLESPPRSIFDGEADGPLVLPGDYTVTMGKRINGVVTQLSSPQTFTVKELDNSPELSEDRAVTLAFQQETADLARAVSAVGVVGAELQNRVNHIKVAIEALSEPNDAQRADAQAIESLLDDAREAIYGDNTVASRNEPVPFSIAQRVGQIRGWGWSHQSPVTSSDKRALEIAKAEFSAVLAQMRDIELRLEALERELGTKGAPYTPGSGLPVWPLPL
ncbi:MAG: glycosyl hydrolase [Erythrobacter sp.]|uniref:WD40/YVTN/BNR-like repeat-containing protein n=1 Tax=Erythrobacter sp. TaxID=1042 RepID=UPI00261F450F|nr:glycosyl hydrolase [Erythrobacter sp.]MDJ0978699.1 glycosyl hydrolase [Erythrobacter sp.]